MTRAPKPVRATLKALWREFRRCSNVYRPLHHELFLPWADISLSQYDVLDVCRSFRTAFADRFQDEWEKWHGPDDIRYFGRFFGSGDGLDEFTKLAESSYLTACEIGANESDSGFHSYPPEHGYHGWLNLLTDMAYGYPTPLLRCEFAVWDENERTGLEEELARVGSPEGGSPPYPLHPFRMRLVHPVFTSSMAAIELILDDDRGLLIGEPVWGLPISFSGRADEVEHVAVPQKAEEQAEPAEEREEGFFGPVRQFSYDGAVWHLASDTDHGGKPQLFLTEGKGFAVYSELLRQPNRMISPVDLLYYTHQIAMAVLGSEGRQDDTKGISKLRNEILRLTEEIAHTEDADLRTELERERKDLLSSKKFVQNEFGRPRRERTPYEEFTNQVFGQLIRARNRIAIKMPRFAAYLRKAVRANGADFYYFP